ncbi:MAG: NlpC/P60 family protein [Desulfuromusa sp.]|nr:NlpC/P60 family protein [Desulfuromusa sp.]
MTYVKLFIGCLCLLFLLCSCSFAPPSPRLSTDPISELLAESPSSSSLQKMGYSVQVGAFKQLENAVRLEQLLNRQGIEAYHFLHESGLYKVRFGNHADYSAARSEAEQLQAQKVIGRFFIVSPEDYTAAKILRGDKGNLREELVGTARKFLGVPYRWGGEDRNNGFDCSGLTMTSYRLNGLNLPRNSRAQFKAGHSLKKKELRKGDLVFFATKGGKRVTHVGMYIGAGQFIHAPRPGKMVQVANLSDKFFKKTYVGGRSYL